jgi:hypothetical protein
MSDQQIVEMYLSGTDSMTVGLNAGCDAQTVLKLVRAAGYQTRRPGGVKKIKASSLSMDQAARLYRAGLSVQEVADKAGLDRSTMANRLKEHGVEIRTLPEVAKLKSRQGRTFGRPPLGSPKGDR